MANLLQGCKRKTAHTQTQNLETKGVQLSRGHVAVGMVRVSATALAAFRRCIHCIKID